MNDFIQIFVITKKKSKYKDVKGRKEFQRVLSVVIVKDKKMINW